MTRVEAERRAVKRWGKRALWSVGGTVSSPEKRGDAKAIMDGARTKRTELEAEIKRREEAAGIAELRERIKALGIVARERGLGQASYYRFRVGFRDSVLGAFNVVGEGDTWEEAFAAAEKRDTIGDPARRAS